MELENEADRGKNQIISVEKAIYPHTGRWLQTGDLGMNLISWESPPTARFTHSSGGKTGVF